MYAPPLMQTSEESLLVSQVEKHWPLLLPGTNCSLILLTFYYYFFESLYLFMAVFVSGVLELLLSTKQIHFGLCFLLFTSYCFYFFLSCSVLACILSQLNNIFSVKLSQGHTSVLCRTQPPTTEI